ncbi:hypothetical protein K9O30_16650 [Clostridium bowmanii]|uniref:hypothetical protein n=1 Tax=Clostridium bowmanii TaxID=132925 RepID=UPI001C0DF3F6|nr:hypothetical protein [Clostridium bowmanii]MBU3190997.1 hypothetical protein [Clostridium bowmanii]MCA1075319.1 hypothetical protein [Clostridium bowmanii]
MYLQKCSLDEENLKDNLKTYNKVTGVLCFKIDEFSETIYSERQTCVSKWISSFCNCHCYWREV